MFKLFKFKALGKFAENRVYVLIFSVLTLALLQAITATRAQNSENSPQPPRPSYAAVKADQSLLLAGLRCRESWIAVGERGHILLSTHAENWKQVSSPTRVMLTNITQSDSGQLWVCGHDATILHSADHGYSWQLQHSDINASPLFDIFFENDLHGVAIGAFGLLMETHDGGRNWTSRSLIEDEPHLYDLSTDGQGMLYLVGEFGSVFSSQDFGRSWQKLNSPYAEGTFFGSLCYGDRLLVFGLRGHAFYSDDKGNSWTKSQVPVQHSLTSGLQLLDNPTIVLAGMAGTILASNDSGVSFQAKSRGDRNAISLVLQPTRESLLLLGEDGYQKLKLDSLELSK